MTYGYWMNRKGKYFTTAEHGNSVINNPNKFRLSKKEIEDILKNHNYNPKSTDQVSGRGKVLEAAFKKGFIRIRGSGSAGYSFQFWGKPKQVVELILEDFGEENFGDYTFITLTDLSSDWNWKGSYQELKKEHLEGTFDINSRPTSTKKGKNVRQDMRSRLLPPGAVFGESIRNIVRKSLFKD